MPKVNTVLGEVDTADLGFTLMHEHIMSVNWPMRQAYSDWVDPEFVINEAVSNLRSAKKKGVKSIVDVTPINLGRDINIIREVSERVKLPRIGGHYIKHHIQWGRTTNGRDATEVQQGVQARGSSAS